MCLGGALVRARMYIVHSRTSETRCTLAVQESEYIDQGPGFHC